MHNNVFNHFPPKKRFLQILRDDNFVDTIYNNVLGFFDGFFKFS